MKSEGEIEWERSIYYESKIKKREKKKKRPLVGEVAAGAVRGGEKIYNKPAAVATTVSLERKEKKSKCNWRHVK